MLAVKLLLLVVAVVVVPPLPLLFGRVLNRLLLVWLLMLLLSCR